MLVGTRGEKITPGLHPLGAPFSRATSARDSRFHAATDRAGDDTLGGRIRQCPMDVRLRHTGNAPCLIQEAD